MAAKARIMQQQKLLHPETEPNKPPPKPSSSLTDAQLLAQLQEHPIDTIFLKKHFDPIPVVVSTLLEEKPLKQSIF